MIAPTTCSFLVFPISQTAWRITIAFCTLLCITTRARPFPHRRRSGGTGTPPRRRPPVSASSLPWWDQAVGAPVDQEDKAYFSAGTQQSGVDK